MDDDDDELRALRQQVADAPDAPGAHAALATALQARGALDDAIGAHRAAVDAAHQQAAIASYNLGAALVAAGRLDDAAAAFATATTLAPRWLPPLDNLTAMRALLGQWPEAEAAARAALALAPDHALAHHHLGLVCGQTARLDEAAAHHRAALAADPTLADAALALGATLTAQGDHAAARAAYRQARALAPTRADAALALALAELAHGTVADAVTTAAAARALAPTDPRGHAVHGSALTRAGDHAAAAAAYAAARDLTPDDPDAHYNCALAAEAADQPDLAIAHYRAALARAPRHLPSLLNLSRVLVDLRRLDELEPLYQEIEALVPANTMTPHLRAALRGELTAAAPRAYVVDLFDALAPRFDDLMVGTLRYAGHRRLAALIADRAAGRRFARALDLGCGSGLVAPLVRDHVAWLAGVDLAPRMIEVARARGLYDELTVADVVDHLATVPAATLALVTAADVLIYLGDLAPLFAAVARALTDAGWFAFTVERSDADDVVLQATGRYAHGRAYVARLAAAHGLTVLALEAFEVRHEADLPVPGWLVLLARAP
ncbi:MAG: tetratricopeptide repeat protein [Myxococcales bacterium]|nr:tetratricopeptide repeat protein [Myxococcales bacterium]